MVLAQCEAAVAAVAALDVSTLDRDRYFRFVAAVQRHLDQLHVAHARSLRFGEVTHRYVGTGSRSMADWLSSHTGSSYGDGMIAGSFVLPLLAARQVQASVASLAGKPSDSDCRSTAQRYADGLVLLADAYAKGDIIGGRERATLVVNVPVDSLLAGGDTPATTVFGDLLPAFVARRLAGDAAVRKIVTDGLEVLALGRAHRLASTAQWLALVTRDRGCRWPGCTIPATWCDVDHFVPWEHGGDTNLDNLWLLCRHHHTERHRPGVTLTGTVLDAQLTLADGTPIACRACPPGQTHTRQRQTTAAA